MGRAASPDTAALLATWVRGWAASRGCAAPVAGRGGWQVDVGLPDQRRRHVFPGLVDGVRELGETITEPWVWLKACTTAEQMRAALPPRWTVRPETFFMGFDAKPPRAPPLPPGYALSISETDGTTVARVLATDGTTACDGRIVIVDDSAIFDRIATEASHRRRGLGRVVMGALHSAAQSAGATRGLLAATHDGHALYVTLGWRVLSPYASAVIVMD